MNCRQRKTAALQKPIKRRREGSIKERYPEHPELAATVAREWHEKREKEREERKRETHGSVIYSSHSPTSITCVRAQPCPEWRHGARSSKFHES